MLTYHYFSNKYIKSHIDIKMISKSHFVGEHIANINSCYNFIQELGRGSYGHVIRVQNINTGNIYACKKMNKRQIANKERFKTEIDLLRATDHPNIIKLYDIYEDNIFLYLIMEECLGGEFFDRLAIRAKQLNMYTEKDAARILNMDIPQDIKKHIYALPLRVKIIDNEDSMLESCVLNMIKS